MSTNWGDREQSAGQQWQDWRDKNPDSVIGWRPSCDHYAQYKIAMLVDYPNRSADTEKRRRQDLQGEWIKRALRSPKPLAWILHRWPHVAGIVLDPFVGSGTTVMVAQQLLRHGIGLDISMPYLDGQAKLRANLGSPRDALDGLPMFQELSEPGPSGAMRASADD